VIEKAIHAIVSPADITVYVEPAEVVKPPIKKAKK